SEVDAQAQNRSMYTTTVFNSHIKCSGTFSIPDFLSHDIKEEDVMWGKATILIQSSNLKGIRNEVAINLNGEKYGFVPKYKTPVNAYSEYTPYDKPIVLQQLESGVINPEHITKDTASSFNFEFNVNGSEQLS